MGVAFSIFYPNFFSYGTTEQFAFVDYTVISGNGGIFDHAHVVDQVELTPDLLAMGASFAFTQTTFNYLHNHDGTYFVKQPTDRSHILDVFHVVHGVAEKTNFLNVKDGHRHQIHVIYTATAPQKAQRHKLVQNTRRRPASHVFSRISNGRVR